MTLSPSIIDEVLALVRDRGEVSKDEVLAAWPLDEDEYAVLRDKILALPGIESGGRHIGGFVVSGRRGQLPDEVDSDPLALRSGWEIAAVDRLCELLQHAQLEHLLGGLLHTIRQVRKHQSGNDRRGTKRELAAALVIRHGHDLLRETEVRKAVGKACQVHAPKRWFPGKAGATEFVEKSGFPLELAGVRTTGARPDFELLEGSVVLKPLWKFQREVQRELLNQLSEPGRRGLVTLPTGAGKTRVAVESLRLWLADRYNAHAHSTDKGLVIWLAHTEELCEQAYACFKEVWEAGTQHSPLLLVRFWGRYTSRVETMAEVIYQAKLLPSVMISTPQRLVNLIRGNIQNGQQVICNLSEASGLVVIDEAHRAAAKSYREIVEAFTNLSHPVSVVGMTATPFRMEYLRDNSDQGTVELREIFRTLIQPLETLGTNPRERLQAMGVLARPHFETLETSTALRLPDYDPESLEDEPTVDRLDQTLKLRTDNSPRRLLVHERLREIVAQDSASVLYFGPSVRDAECMAYMLRASGVPSAVVTGATRDAVRREAIEDFKSGEIKVLCNCEVLTTGFDAPRVTHLVMARPTVSQVLYEQMVGRGLRGPKFGGTETCTLIDCKDEIRGQKPELGYEAFRRVWGR